MDSIRCPRCEFANWASDTMCSRCGSPLAFIENVLSETGGQHRPAGVGLHVCTFCGTEFEGYFCTLCRKPKETAEPPEPVVEQSSFSALLASKKAKVAVAAAVVCVVAAAVFVVRGHGEAAQADKFQAELIQKSFDFQTPVTVSFSERGEAVAPGLEVLRELGLVSYRRGMLTLRRAEPDLAVWVEDLSPGERGDRVPSAKPVEFTQVALTDAGARESEGWGTFKSQNGAATPWGEARGWRVPLGTREFLGVRGVQPVSKGSFELSEVVFSWRWRPNELGRHFDVSGEEFTRLSAGGQLSAISRHFNDSTKTYTARAMLKLDGRKWSVSGVSFEEDGEAKTELMR